GAKNLFGGSVWVGAESDGGAARNVELIATGDLKFSKAITLTGSLIAKSGGSITQDAAFDVTGATTLSATGAITLDQQNKFTTIDILGAESAVIHNEQDLSLGVVESVDQLTLDVTGDLGQTAALILNELTLAVTGETALVLPGNSVATLSGKVVSGEVSSIGDMQLG